MNALVAAFAVIFAIPLFFGSWRLALVGLGAQSFLILFMLILGSHGQHLAGAVLLIVDLAVVRGVLGPLAIARAARLGGAADDALELFPGDLLHWVIAAAILALGIQLGWRLFPGDFGRAAHTALAATEVMLGFKIVAHQRTLLGQAIGMLTIENGAVLAEALVGYHWPRPLHVGLMAVFIGLVLVVVGLLQREVDASHAPVETSAAVEVL